MFLDSDVNTDISSYSDENFLNHPGFLGGTWWKDFWRPKAAEAERYDKAVDTYNNKYKLDSDLDCDEIDQTITDIDADITSTMNSGAKDRVISRNSRALENRRSAFKKAWEDDDCSQKRIDAQTAEFNQQVQSMFNQANQRSSGRNVEDKTLVNVAIGVGALVIGAVVIMSFKN